jgi:hypothetical protein
MDASLNLNISDQLRLKVIAHPFLSLFIFFLLLHIASIIYNLYFHPLAKFPGPKLAAATRLSGLSLSSKTALLIENRYEAYYEMCNGGGLFSAQIEKMHQEYGMPPDT